MGWLLRQHADHWAALTPGRATTRNASQTAINTLPYACCHPLISYCSCEIATHQSSSKTRCYVSAKSCRCDRLHIMHILSQPTLVSGIEDSSGVWSMACGYGLLNLKKGFEDATSTADVANARAASWASCPCCLRVESSMSTRCLTTLNCTHCSSKRPEIHQLVTNYLHCCSARLAHSAVLGLQAS